MFSAKRELFFFWVIQFFLSCNSGPELLKVLLQVSLIFFFFCIRDIEFCSSFFLNCCTWSNRFSLFIPRLQLVDNKWFDASVLLLSIITWFLSCMW
ncbi:hypothetical protein NC652_031611 [Populus alba x Populus x berolinensis]|nr:hypothetical protein NC652_031611 [Populus alba x Populus x berolinensis]